VARLRKSHLPHTVSIVRLTGEGSEGSTWADPVSAPAYVEQKSRLIVDRRSTSSTAGQEITSTAFVVLLVEDDTLPRSRVTVWAGTPREHEAEVINSALLDYKGAPTHVELYI
jgi:hypothetical protein